MTDPLAHDPAGYGDSVPLVPLAAEVQAQEQDIPLETEHHARDSLTLQTDIQGAPEGDITEPATAAAESPEDGRGGERGEGGDEDADWAFPVKTKKKKGGNTSASVSTPVTPGAAAGGGGDEGWANTGKKKKGKKGK